MAFVVKICGLTTPEAVEVAVRAGATAVGVVLALSSRQVDPGRAAELLAAARGVERIAVFRTPAPALLAAVRGLPFDGAQVDAAWAGSLPTGWFRVPAYRDTPGDHAALAALAWPAASPGSLRGAFLLDGPRGGGLGERADVERAALAAARGPCVLAGGLDPDNVAGAIMAVRPYGVDVSSGVEASPGRKDPVRVEAFVAAARTAFARQHTDEVTG